MLPPQKTIPYMKHNTLTPATRAGRPAGGGGGGVGGGGVVPADMTADAAQVRRGGGEMEPGDVTEYLPAQAAHRCE